MRANTSQQVRCQGGGKLVKLDTFLFLPVCKFISLCAAASFYMKLGRWEDKKKKKPKIHPQCSFTQEWDLYRILAGVSGYQWPHTKHWKRSSTGKKAKTCHRQICNTSCCSSTARDYHLQMASWYQDPKPPTLGCFLQSSWVAGSYANIGSKNLFAFTRKIALRAWPRLPPFCHPTRKVSTFSTSSPPVQHWASSSLPLQHWST